MWGGRLDSEQTREKAALALTPTCSRGQPTSKRPLNAPDPKPMRMQSLHFWRCPWRCPARISRAHWTLQRQGLDAHQGQHRHWSLRSEDPQTSAIEARGTIHPCGSQCRVCPRSPVGVSRPSAVPTAQAPRTGHTWCDCQTCSVCTGGPERAVVTSQANPASVSADTVHTMFPAMFQGIVRQVDGPAVDEGRTASAKNCSNFGGERGNSFRDCTSIVTDPMALVVQSEYAEE